MPTAMMSPTCSPWTSGSSRRSRQPRNSGDRCAIAFLVSSPGYDHLMFLVGVVFFLYRLKDVVQYVSLFTIGHSITLLAGGIQANAYIIDAMIGVSVAYK